MIIIFIIYIRPRVVTIATNGDMDLMVILEDSELVSGSFNYGMNALELLFKILINMYNTIILLILIYVLINLKVFFLF